MIVRTIYEEVCTVLMEDGGLSAGILTVDQFLSLFNNLLQDYYQNTAILKRLINVEITAGVSVYIEPDHAMVVEDALYDGTYINRESGFSQDRMLYKWRTETGAPCRWREDRSAVKRITLNPIPSTSGQRVGTSAALYGTIGAITNGTSTVTVTSALYGTVESYAGSVYIEASGVMLGTLETAIPMRGNLTLIATTKPYSGWLELDDNIELLPDSFVHYLKYGTLEAIFTLDGETKDQLRAGYCAARYREGLNLGRAISQEALDEEQQQQQA